MGSPQKPPPPARFPLTVNLETVLDQAAKSLNEQEFIEAIAGFLFECEHSDAVIAKFKKWYDDNDLKWPTQDLQEGNCLTCRHCFVGEDAEPCRTCISDGVGGETPKWEPKQ